MRHPVRAFALLLLLALLGCNEKPAAQLPPPHKMTAELIGHYCGMNVLEHPGPKGQIFVTSLRAGLVLLGPGHHRLHDAAR